VFLKSLFLPVASNPLLNGSLQGFNSETNIDG
jgi:hypothetical protein